MSRKVISFSDFSAGREFDAMVEFVSLFNKMIQVFNFLSLSQREKISSVNRLNSFCLVLLCCISVVSILAMKLLANDTAILVPMAVPCVWR